MRTVRAGAGHTPGARAAIPGCRTRWVSWLARRRKSCSLWVLVSALGVLSEMMEAELDEVVGAKHRQALQTRTAVRHGHEDGEVTLGGRRVAVRRPRARTVDDEQRGAVGDVSSISLTVTR